MKFICVGRNYAEHARELGNEVPEAPLLFMKPETALWRGGDSLPLPAFSQNIHYEAELVIRIAKTVRNITVSEADSCWENLTLGLDLTARDLQDQLKAKGYPWEIAKAFDGSAVLGTWADRRQVADSEGHFQFELLKNGTIAQRGDSRDMIRGCNELIAYMSQFFTLEAGDMIFTGTPAGVGPLAHGDVLEGRLAGQTYFTVGMSK